MRAFARLLEDLVFAPGRNAKLAHLVHYFRTTPDPDRGWAVAALTEELSLPAVTPSRLRGLVEERVDPVLFQLSHDFVGDLAETVALIWPDGEGQDVPSLGAVVERMAGAGPVGAGSALADLCERMGASERLALIKLCAGTMRAGISPGLVRAALAQFADDPARPVSRLEALWAGLHPPYRDLFDWLEGGAEPDVDLTLAFRPVMLANPLDEARLAAMEPGDWLAEWKWGGMRVQATARDGERLLYARTGDDIGRAFPDVLATMTWQGTVDGELLVVRDGAVAPFADLQKRLGRKRVGAKTLAGSPAHLRLYDLLHDGERDLRSLPLTDRRAALEIWLTRHDPARTDLSRTLPFVGWPDLIQLRATSPVAGQEGLMLKRRDAPYAGGRAMGQWLKWKRDPLTADCVMVYAQRGHGRRSSFFTDFTFAAWRAGQAGPELVPVGKAQFGDADAELAELDDWIRSNTIDRFGPVRAVRPELVLEVTFDAVQHSKRHKSGIVMRLPQIRRIRWDKPADQADRLETFAALIVA